MDVNVFYNEASELVHDLEKEEPGMMDVALEATLRSLWDDADDEADAIEAATQRAQQVARRHAPQDKTDTTVWSLTTAVFASRKPGYKRARTSSAQEIVDPMAREQRSMDAALEQAFALADKVGDA